MKKLLLSAFAVVLCSAMMAQNSAELKFNLQKNKTYKLSSSSVQNISQTVNGMAMSTEVKSISAVSIKMVDSKPEFMIAEVRFDSIIINTNAMGRVVKNNSNTPGNIKSSETSDVMNCALNRMCSNPIFVKMDYSGKVIEIVNLKLYADVVSKDIDSIQGQAAPMLKMQISNMIKPEALKTMIESTFAYLPGKKVAVGESWEVKLSVNSNGMKLSSAANYKLVSISNDIATISAEANIVPDGNEPMDMGGMKINYSDLKGLGKSTILVDIKTGLIKEQTGKNNIAGNMSVDAGGNNMQIPMEIQGESKTVAIQ